MEDLLEKGYARRVLEDQENKPSRYLPHHPVIHAHKPSKVRVVFDCAVRFQGASLNEQIMQGPDLTNTLIGFCLDSDRSQLQSWLMLNRCSIKY